ncbi:MAG: NADH-quinone oxidoreductase subunit L [Candidatus Lightella neohaematopini]|nr:NADH-quinone oxidoreductase subunit L [Candidatus Lightella neohaematopini]
MNLLYLLILFPLTGYLLLCCVNKKNYSIINLINFLVIGLLTVTIIIITNRYHNTTLVIKQTLWELSLPQITLSYSLYLDQLSLVMSWLIIGVGLLIKIYSLWYMNKKEGYSRFFAYINLFITGMLIVILADNLFFMFFGWELVSFCSYLLIGFYYRDDNNYYSAMKSFIMNRFSDIFLLVAIFLIYYEYKSFNFNDIDNNLMLYHNKTVLLLITYMIVIGIIGKSAQFPLYSWLKDAMVGPTPVSALIHSTTMVTIGIYLVIRMHKIFALTPTTLLFMQYIGIITIIISSLSALLQSNIKKILAYSTVSQISYMFITLSISAWNISLYYLVIHAFCKSLLFLSTGVLINIYGEQQIFKLSPIKKLPIITYLGFLVGGSSLSAFPFITAGFYSKSNIINYILISNNYYLFCIVIFSTIITTMYTFRTILIIYNKINIEFKILNNFNVYRDIPIIILIILATVIGAIIVSYKINIVNYNNSISSILFELIFVIINIISIVISINIWYCQKFLIKDNYYFSCIKYLLLYGLDQLYKNILIKPYYLITNKLQSDPLTKLINFVIFIIKYINNFILYTETNILHWYINSTLIGLVVLLFIYIYNFYIF